MDLACGLWLAKSYFRVWFSKCDPWISSSHLTWELAKNENSSKTSDSETGEWSPASYVF